MLGKNDFVEHVAVPNLRSTLLLCISLSTHRPTSINLKVHTCNELALITPKIQAQVGDIVWICQSPKRHVAEEVLHVLRCVLDANEC